MPSIIAYNIQQQRSSLNIIHQDTAHTWFERGWVRLEAIVEVLLPCAASNRTAAKLLRLCSAAASSSSWSALASRDRCRRRLRGAAS